MSIIGQKSYQETWRKCHSPLQLERVTDCELLRRRLLQLIRGALLAAQMTLVFPGCEAGVAPESPTSSEQSLSSSTGQDKGKQNSDHSSDGNGARPSNNTLKEKELQIVLEFEKSELQRFEAALRERQQSAIERVTVAQIKVDELQKKISRYTEKMAKQALTGQETLDFEQAKRDKVDAERQLAAEKDVRGLNEKPLEALIQAKRDEIIRLEVTLLTLKNQASQP